VSNEDIARAIAEAGREIGKEGASGMGAIEGLSVKVGDAGETIGASIESAGHAIERGLESIAHAINTHPFPPDDIGIHLQHSPGLESIDRIAGAIERLAQAVEERSA